MALLLFKQSEVINAFKANCQTNKGLCSKLDCFLHHGIQIVSDPAIGPLLIQNYQHSFFSSKQHKLQKLAQPGNHCGRVPFDVWPVVKAIVTRLAERSQTAWSDRGIVPNNGKPPVKSTEACGSNFKSQQKCIYLLLHTKKKKPGKEHARIFLPLI